MATSFVTVVVVVMLACSFIAVSVSVSGSSCIFIFGDSLVDTGNNNYITMLARADIWYNGIDFANGFPTGKFCNGRTALDYLCMHHLFHLQVSSFFISTVVNLLH